MKRMTVPWILGGALATLLLTASSPSVLAQFTLPGQGRIDFPATVAVRLVPESAQPGEKVKLEVNVTLEPGYHTYDLEQPDLKAVASQITLEPTEPLEVLGEWTGTPPEETVDDVLKKRIYVHYGSLTWTREIRVPSDAAPGEVKIAGKLRFTVCDEKGCLPPKTEKFEVALKVKAAGTGIRSVAGAHSDSPATDNSADTSAAKETIEEGTRPDEKKLTVIRTQKQVGSLANGVLFGFLAGLILNVMPCVLPVISLKIYGFLKQSGEDRRRVRLLGLAFGAGIMFVFLILAGLAAFAGLGWGQQFQSDKFVVAMIALMVAFALGMFDVYVIQLPGMVSTVEAATAQKEGLAGSFAKGMLATLLATPCSGPFLGATLSYALTQPPAVIFAIFSAIGVGMAFPYVVLAANPGWMKKLPRPGEWMTGFKEFMGFMMLGTAVWLLWQRRKDGELVVWTVAFSVCVALAMWFYGRWSRPQLSATKRYAAPLLAMFLMAFSAYFCFGVMYQPPQPVTATMDSKEDTVIGAWQRYSLDKVIALRSQGTTVIVDWTADW